MRSISANTNLVHNLFIDSYKCWKFSTFNFVNNTWPIGTNHTLRAIFYSPKLKAGFQHADFSASV